MNNHTALCLFLVLLPWAPVLCADHEQEQQQVYVVYLGGHSGSKTSQQIEDIHRSYLHFVKLSNEEARDSIVYSYKNAINGFSAMLTPQEAQTISEMDGVISVFVSQPSILHTTRSWDFISLLEANWDESKANGEDLLKKAGYGQDVTVGIVDSGVWPESESFSDTDMEPVPAYWKGTCQTGDEFTSSNCNKKIVGARYYLKGYEAYYGPLDPKLDFKSPRDSNGHGTHTASTVGGRRVRNAAAIGGLGSGVASGGAPLVRLAIYKACWPIPNKMVAEGNVCFDDDMLAAMDDAIADGVQVMSLSIGKTNSTEFAKDGISIGALHAVKKNIVVSCSAGNSGPAAGTVTNVAPWLITVAASSIDRVFSSPVTLGNGVALGGQSITPMDKAKTYPLVYAADVEIPGSTTNETIGLCLNGTLSPDLVKGKAVFCWRGDTFETLEVSRAGGVAAVLGNPRQGMGLLGRPYMIPATVINSVDVDTIYKYIESDTTAATAGLTPVQTLADTKPAPFMAAFTSRGPSAVEPNILKPDITAPGLNILAAWSEASSPLMVPSDTRVVKYHLDSGTSMSCPHVSGVAVLLKAIYPDWSGAAVRSALMTSTKLTNNEGNTITDAKGNPSTPFEFGSGHIQPSLAANPGLIYDATYEDYLLFLCSSSGNQLDPSFTCPAKLPPQSNLNYPSLAIAGLKGALTVDRAVTNVGAGKASYNVTITEPEGYKVVIAPAALDFSAAGEKQSFKVTVEAGAAAKKEVYSFGSFVWSDGTHQVASVVAVTAG